MAVPVRIIVVALFSEDVTFAVLWDKKKLIRFEAIRQFANVLEYPAGMPGQWGHSLKRPPHQPGACLREGEYAVGLGRLYKNQNFLGVDLKGNRIWKGAKTALDEGLDNVGFCGRR